MKRSSYGERDYAFGQEMLTLRTHIGLTQAGLAELLGVSRRAVAEWEAGSSYPKVERLKQLIALALQQQAFAVGREAEEIRALWKAAHQKLLLDESWLATLLSRPRPALILLPSVLVEEPQRGEVPTAPRMPGRRVDWGEALAVPTFYRREREMAQLTQWVLQERCRVVSVLGMGGIGKSALAVNLMHQLAPHFEVVIWRSLRDAPSCEALLEDCLQVLAPQPLREVPTSLERRLGLLLEYLREERVLLVLDNLEVLLEEGEGTGRMRAGYEDYGRLLRRVAQTEHQSCLLLTSREKPRDLVALEGSRTPVRSLRLAGLDAVASEQLLAEKDVAGTTPERTRLIEAYAGNPLALKIVAETIVELFGSEIAPFLEQGEVVFGSVRELLVTVWDGGGRMPPRGLRGHSWIVYGVAWSPDGQLLASSGFDNAIRVWDASTGEGRQTLRDPDHVETLFYGVEWSPNGKFLASGSYQREVQVWEVTTGTRCWVGRGQPTRIRRVAWSPDGARLASCGDDGGVCLWQVSDGTLLTKLQGPRGMAASGGGGRGELFVWEARSGERLYTLSEPNAVVQALAWSPSGTQLLSGGSDGMLRWWDLQRGECVRVRKAHQGAVQSLKLSPDGRLLASCGDDGAIHLWDLESGERVRTLRRDRPYERLDITGVQGLTEAQRASLLALGAVEERERLLKA